VRSSRAAGLIRVDIPDRVADRLQSLPNFCHGPTRRTPVDDPVKQGLGRGHADIASGRAPHTAELRRLRAARYCLPIHATCANAGSLSLSLQSLAERKSGRIDVVAAVRRSYTPAGSLLTQSSLRLYVIQRGNDPVKSNNFNVFSPIGIETPCRCTLPLYTTRESIEGGNLAAFDLDVALVDLLPEITYLGIEISFVDVDMP
jgi:hypothetical protein